MQPQIVKISSETQSKNVKHQLRYGLKLPCPFDLLRQYSKARIPFTNENDQFFIFNDNWPVSAEDMRKCLKRALTSVGFDPHFYGLYSIRAGRAGDLLKLGLNIEDVKRIGRWKSNAVFRYLKYT